MKSIKIVLIVVFFLATFQVIVPAQIPKENDRIGWSSDGNKNDPDDWSATPLALAIFNKMGWHDKLVHFDYNNRLDATLEWKEAENYESTIGGAQRFNFNTEIFFDDQRELELAIEHAKQEINKSHEGSKFWYVQAGPFEVAYQALLRAEPEKRQYCILVSHAEINERADKWKLEDGSPSHGKDDCVALGAKYFFTSKQGKDKFGGRAYDGWDKVEWMKNSTNENYRWLYSRFLETAKHKDNGLDASDGGMAYVLATGDKDGNFAPKLKDFLLKDEKTSTEWNPLFNGVNFDGWFMMLRKNDDPQLKKKVFKVEDGKMHFFKDIPANFDSVAAPKDRRTFGAIFTDKKYANYIFRFEYKWGNKSVNCPQKLKLNNGCFYHVSEAKIWPKAIEFQIQYNHISNQSNTGAVLRGGNTYTVYGANEDSNNFLPPSEGGKAISGRLKGFGARPLKVDPEQALDWNQCEIIVMGNQYAIHKINGKVVNVITDISVGEGNIGFQAEFAEIYLRNIEIKEFNNPMPIETFYEF